MEVRICRICLRAEGKFYHSDSFKLKTYYEEAIGLKVPTNDVCPKYFCIECATYLNKFHKFRRRCLVGRDALKQLLIMGPITYETVKKIDRKRSNLTSALDYIDSDSDNVGVLHLQHIISEIKNESEYSTLDESLVKTDADGTEKFEIDFVDHFDDNYATEVVTTEDLPAEAIQAEYLPAEDPPAEDLPSEELPMADLSTEGLEVTQDAIDDTVVLIIKGEPGDYAVEPKVIRYDNMLNCGTRILDPQKWKLYILSEDDAMREFNLKCLNAKYMRAPYRCTDCYKGFSREDMLDRHVMLRHDESLGPFLCKFCKMRFKWESHLRIHLKQHYTKCQCLRCSFVCSLESTAALHEEHHNSGITRKCIHCDQKFRHASTFYNHLHTAHPSEYTCDLCGVSFVSDEELHQHKMVKHGNADLVPQDSPDDDDELNMFCECCGIAFETAKDFEEHKFHCDLHAGGAEREIEDQITILHKMSGKKLPEQVNMEMRKINPDEDKKKQIKRPARKPSTCHQCGMHFDTRTACMKHHLVEHPGTSFYAARHICEICGMSLAPPSVYAHMNMHTKEKIYACESCDKQFTSTVGLKRHLVTHTGEKKYKCSLCEKRFTQSNSMKLHYRTFHLRQPYPKRNRQKRKDADLETKLELEAEETGTDQEMSEVESDMVEVQMQDDGVETHTGEKKYKCSLCEKRFTQSNSMKLHYRTFHLRQPYPKRNRQRKKKADLEAKLELELEAEETGTDQEMSEVESDMVQVQMQDDEVEVHYLTLN